jgi:protocatechuate 3,4-dioxygenase beta subunit
MALKVPGGPEIFTGCIRLLDFKSIESNFPPGYSGRPPHIHIRISANGFRSLATQHYPEIDQKAAPSQID